MLAVPRANSSFRDTTGLTLPEILVAMAVLTIGLLGMASALVVSSAGVSAGITGGQGAIERGAAVSTAMMLAQERLEQVKRAPYTITGPVDQITAANFPTEAFGSITGYANFSRSVAIQDSTPGANMKTVTVTVRYKYAAAAGMVQEGVGLSTIIAARP
ncbi:MAG: prepilin-type N-terminal cleavage/methylation domain-containing protein [Candidatus Rokubacteria bacterium]|nr:prepilin-type N-terminal cleavage/methylation domain-containing protein [Candidatus Rokubacteria bacterium]